MWKTILAGLRARTARLVLSSIAIALGVAFVTGTLVLGDAVEAQTKDNFARSARNVDASVQLSENADRETFKNGIPLETLQKIRGTQGVAGADAREYGSAALLGSDGKARPAGIMPLPTTEKLRDFNLKEGRFPTGATEVSIDVKTAETAKLKVGDKLKLLDENGAERQFTIVGTYTQGVSALSMGGGDHAVLSPEGMRTMVPEQRIYQVVAVAAPGVTQQQLVDNINKTVGTTGYKVQTGAQLTQETLESVGDAAGEIKMFLLAFAAISLVVAGMVIYNTFTILVAQRTRELALLRCVGADRGQVFRSVLAEALFMGLAASVLGILGGLGVSAGLQALIGSFGGPSGGETEIRLPISWVTIAAGFGVGVVVTVLSAVLPARRATTVAPVAALRSQPDSHDDVARTGKVRIVFATLFALAGAGAVYLGMNMEEEAALFVTGGGTMVLLLAVLLLGPLYVGPVNRLFGKPLRGVPAKLASANAGRNPKRTAATTAALMIGVTIVAMISVVAGSGRATLNEEVDKQFPADYEVTSNVWSQPLTQKFADDLAKVKNVAKVSPTLSASVQKSDKLEYPYFSGFEPSVLGDLVRAETTTGTLGTLKDNEVALNEKEATKVGLKVGDTIKLDDKDFKVAALLKSRDYGDGIVTLSTAKAMAEGQRGEALKGYQKLLVKLAPGTDVATARADLERVIATSPSAVLNTAAETKAELNAQIDQVLMFIWALVGLALIIALFGIANTLTLSVLERTRESALLRALGLTRGQLRQMLVVESILMALIGAVVGVLLGAGFGYLLVEAISSPDIPITFSIPFEQIGIMLVLAVVAAIIAAALPARRAARNSVVAGMAEA